MGDAEGAGFRRHTPRCCSGIVLRLRCIARLLEIHARVLALKAVRMNSVPKVRKLPRSITFEVRP